MEWGHDLEYNLNDDSMKNNFVLVETSMLKSVWNTYKARGDKASTWCYNFAEIVRGFDKKGWTTNLDGFELKSPIITFLKASILTPADKERNLSMGEVKMIDDDYDSSDSDDSNPFNWLALFNRRIG